MKEKRKKRPFIQTFGIIVIVLALVRCAFPGIADNSDGKDENEQSALSTASVAEDKQSAPPTASVVDETQLVPPAAPVVDEIQSAPSAASVAEDKQSPSYIHSTTQYLPDGAAPHPIYSVPSYDRCFPDSNHVQLVAAKRWGVSPVKNRREAEERKSELVYAALSPYYSVDQLNSSIPYLVPRAAILLQDIGQAFYDSLQVKGIPLHRLMVTSMLRTRDDVATLRRYNGNATENSCHLYGTTFDISYVSFRTVEPPEGPRRRLVRDDTLKFVLSEVLNDMRKQGRCYIKYEKRQSCYHMTVR